MGLALILLSLCFLLPELQNVPEGLCLHELPISLGLTLLMLLLILFNLFNFKAEVPVRLGAPDHPSRICGLFLRRLPLFSDRTAEARVCTGGTAAGDHTHLPCE